MRVLSSVCVAIVFLSVSAAAESNRYSLPSHPGAMVLNLSGLHVTQMTAKPEGREIGVRAHDGGTLELLTFLFLTPEHRSQTAASCMAQDIAQVRKNSGNVQEQTNPFGTDAKDWASVLVTFNDGYQTLYRYAGSGDQCLVAEVYADRGAKLDLERARAVLERQAYDPGYKPTADDAAAYEAIRGRAMLNAPLPNVNPSMLVTWYGPGGIPLPHASEWQLVLLSGYDGGMRPAAQFKNGRTGATISFLLFRNGSGTATAEGCRKDVIEAIDKAEGKLISNALTGELPDGHGGKFATASHSTRLAGKSSNHDVFAFAGNTATCAEIHASVVSGTQDEDRLLKEALSLFRPDLSYQPEWKDYWVEATAFRLQSQITAAPYYAQALHVMPAAATDPAMVNARRVATDEVVIALGMSGKVEQARSYAERGIAIDPDYPMNYYNLACADAEEGNAAAAKVHLRQAFERKANVIPGERMPNPATDDSILKLRKNKEFWAFVQTLNGSR